MYPKARSKPFIQNTYDKLMSRIRIAFDHILIRCLAQNRFILNLGR
jgi:hypothetical protein